MLLDIGIGILASLVVTEIFDLELTHMLLLAGIVCALLPDVDLVTKYHRSWTHYPVIYIPIALVIWLVFGEVWGVLFIVGVYAHLIHDTLWIGPGIKWWAPFSKKAYKFFNQERPYEPGPTIWIREFYLRPTVVSVTEIGGFFIALIVLYFYIV